MIGASPQIRRTELKPLGALVAGRDRELWVKRGVFGAWSPGGRVDGDTLVRRGPDGDPQNNIQAQRGSVEFSETSDEEVIWAGFMVKHYGHFLIESVARLWPLLPGGPLEGRRAVFSGQSMVDSAREWLDASGLQIVELPKSGIVRFRRIAVPQPAIRIGGWIAPELRAIHLGVRERLEVNSRNSDRVLWLSRSGLGLHRTVFDERLLEWLLRDYLNVVRPEHLSLREQIVAIEGSRGVAGVLGSAFHSLLMTDPPPPYVVLCGEKVHSTYVMQDELLGRMGKFRRAVVKLGDHEGGRSRFPGGMRLLIPETVRALRDTVLPELRDDPRFSTVFEGKAPRATRAGGDVLMPMVKDVLRNPESARTRRALASEFGDRGLDDLASEQLQCASDLES